MNNIRTIATVVLFSLCINLNAQKVKPLAVNQTAVIERWRVVEFTFTSSKVYTRPFDEVEMTGEFAGPNNENLKLAGFWDGGNTWKIRVAFPATGNWKMKTTCSDSSNNGLHNITQSISCKPYSGSLAIYKHGFLKVSDNKRYFVYADGTPFFYLGDTHWIYIHERFNSSNVKGISSQFKYIVDKRVSQGFSVYQSEAIQHAHGQNTSKVAGVTSQ